jgi:hypothetical protein
VLEDLVALLSDSTTDARARITVDGPVYNTAGELLADSLDDLFDGTIATPVAYSESGERNLAVAYTGTGIDGLKSTLELESYCGDWTNDTDGVTQIGRADSADARWIAAYTDRPSNPCDAEIAIYCIGAMP